jgi:ribonuclease-3
MKEGEAANLSELERTLGYAFANRALLEQAVTHPSILQDSPAGTQSNQRLEFLGDAVLQLVLSSALYGLYPADREGSLSKRRSTLTKGAFLAELAREIGLDRHLRLGASEETTAGREKASTLEDAFEALAGAVFLDGGFEAARRVLVHLYGSLPARLTFAEDQDNPKGRLQERIQPLHGNRALRYEVVQVEGADHARAYEVEVFLNDRSLGRGRGTSKKLAEEAAARVALAALPPPVAGQ